MIAQCSNCSQTFPTQSWGAQTCPHCGTQVFLEDPNASSAWAGAGDGGSAGAGAGGSAGAGGAPAPGGGGAGQASDGGFGGGPTGPSDPTGGNYDEEGAIPWEERDSRGLFDAFFSTWKQSLFNPTPFFAKMRVDDTKGAFLYAWICQTIGGLIGVFWGWLQWRLQTGLDPSFGGDPQLQELMGFMDLFYGGIGFVAVPLFAAVFPFIWAGLLHLSCMIWGANDRGWNATFRAVAYSSSTSLWSVIPLCGGMVTFFWNIVLQIIAIMHLQRVSGGKAVGVVLTLWGGLCACCCLVYVLLIAGFVSMAGAAGMAEGGGF